MFYLGSGFSPVFQERCYSQKVELGMGLWLQSPGNASLCSLCAISHFLRITGKQPSWKEKGQIAVFGLWEGQNLWLRRMTCIMQPSLEYPEFVSASLKLPLSLLTTTTLVWRHILSLVTTAGSESGPCPQQPSL